MPRAVASLALRSRPADRHGSSAARQPGEVRLPPSTYPGTQPVPFHTTIYLEQTWLYSTKENREKPREAAEGGLAEYCASYSTNVEQKRAGFLRESFLTGLFHNMWDHTFPVPADPCL